ncbi:MAG: hypothetical protein SV186_05980 [Candidatus Nanohaloarchaea archaeon]|nr:hypothetical protein [Candidatus Nanohaloarchaea archaeon]
MIALFIGRFQPLHKGQYRAIRQLKKKYRPVIGIGSSEKMNTFDNPLSFSERRQLFNACLPGFRTFPLPDQDDDSDWVANVADTVSFNVIVTGSEHTQHCFRNEGYTVEEPSTFREETYSGTNVRTLAADGDSGWRELVPGDTIDLLEQFNFVERMQRFSPPA